MPFPEPPPVIRPPVAPRQSSAAIKILIAAAVLAVLGFVGIVVAAIAIPGLLRARMSANEAAAVSSLRSIAEAQLRYATTCGRGGFAGSLATLAVSVPASGNAGPPQIAALAAGPSKGYVFLVGAGKDAAAGPTDCNGRSTSTGWYGSAMPMTFGTTGTRSFATNASGDIWFLPQASAPPEPFEPPASPVR